MMLSRWTRLIPVRATLCARSLVAGSNRPVPTRSRWISTQEHSEESSSGSGEGSEQTVDVEHSTQSHRPPPMNVDTPSSGSQASKSNPSGNAPARRGRRGRNMTDDDHDDMMEAMDNREGLLGTRSHFDNFRGMVNQLMHDFDDSIGGGFLTNRRGRRGGRNRRDPFAMLPSSFFEAPQIGSRAGEESNLPMIADELTDALAPSLDLFPLTQPSPIKVDIESMKDKYCVTAEVPGLKPKDLKVNVDRGILTIEGRYQDERREEDKEHSFLRIERTLGSVHRSMKLPDDVDQDNVKAKYDSGVLKVDLPKKSILPSGNIPIQLDEHGHQPPDTEAQHKSDKETTQGKSKKNK